jgi:hypothetical protein
MFSEGTQVEIHLPGPPPGQYSVGRVAGFYSNEPRRVVVVLPCGVASARAGPGRVGASEMFGSSLARYDATVSALKRRRCARQFAWRRGTDGG